MASVLLLANVVTFHGKTDFTTMLTKLSLFSGMMWADNYRFSCDDREADVAIIKELFDLHMELKPESLWLTSPNKRDTYGR